MRTLVEFPLEGGGSVVVETDDAGRGTDDGEVTRGLGRPDRSIARAGETFEEAVARIQPGALAMVRALREGAGAPDEITVEFGVQLTAELGAVVARTSAQANFTVRMRWQRDGGDGS